MRSLRTQFIAFVLVLLFLLLILLNTYPLTSSRDRIFEEKSASLSSRATVIATALGALETLSRDYVGEVLSYLDVGGISRIIVTDPEGSVVYDSVSAAALPELDALSTALESKTVFQSDFRDSAFFSVAACPVYQQTELVGAVGVFEEDTDRAEMLLSMQSRIRTISLAIAVIAVAVVVLFSELTIRRISTLADSMKIVAGGDYKHRLEVRGRDEITELGKEFNQLTERLDTTEKQRRRFVSDASHELKTPLASIRLLSDSIVQNENMPADTVREFVTDIGSEAERLQRTTEKLLDLSRMDDGIQFAPEPVDVQQTVLDAFVLLKPLADEKQVKLRCNLEEGCVIMASVDDLYHIVFNLMENAIKYNVPEGSVLVTTRSTEDDKIQIITEDTGIGIPEGDRINIFSRFYRVDKARSREAGGSGLGLSIVHDAVLAHGGTITVGANKPCGSRFIVEFPKPTSEETGI